MNNIWQRIKKYNFQSLSKLELMIVLGLVIVGLLLRLGGNSHQIIWSYDQARDSFTTRQLFTEKDLILLGPQAEQYGLFHGPLHYYFIAPFYTISKGETFVPLLAMTFLTFSSAIPLYLLIKKITNNKWAGIISLGIFSLSYEFIEYARWISNVSITLPFVAWSYYLFYCILEDPKISKKYYFSLGLLTGLACQGEIFLLSLGAIFFLMLVIKKNSLHNVVSYLVGIGLGILPLILAQIKFDFMGFKIFSHLFTQNSTQKDIDVVSSLAGYLNHLGMTTHHTIGGTSWSMGFFIFALALVIVVYLIIKKNNSHSSIFLNWFFTILLGHGLLFTFEYVDTFFVDLEFSLFLVVIISLAGYFSYIKNKSLFLILVVLFLGFQFELYNHYLFGRKPFGQYMFIQQTSTLSHLDEIVDKIYESTGDQPFTFSSIGTPYGVRTVWASVFELYSKNHNKPLPLWFGYYAHGYPGDNVLIPATTPQRLHVLVLEDNYDILIPKPIVDQELARQNIFSKVIGEYKMNGAIIQLRQSLITQ